MADRLQIIQRKHFSEYKERQPITISKHLASLEKKLCSSQDFRFNLIASSCNSNMIEGSNLDTETYYRLKEAGFVSIHPFADGNGRMARLLEKWFLAEKLGSVAWRIQSEKLYYKRKRSYYSRLHFRTDYETIDYGRGVDFLTLLPMALNIK